MATTGCPAEGTVPVGSLVGEVRLILKNKTKSYSCPAVCKHTVLEAWGVVTWRSEGQLGQVHSFRGTSTAKLVFLLPLGSQSLDKRMKSNAPHPPKHTQVCITHSDTSKVEESRPDSEHLCQHFLSLGTPILIDIKVQLLSEDDHRESERGEC